MKYSFFIVVVAVFLTAGAASGHAENTMLAGQIVLQNSNGTPLSGVEVFSRGATPTTSDTSGQFELVFWKKKPGDRVRLTLKKTGYEPVNRKSLETVLRADPDDLLIIVMAKDGERDRLAMQYYEISEKNIRKSFDAELKRINDHYAKNLTEKGAATKTLKAERDAALAQAKALSEKFAAVNLDEASDLYKKAFALFKDGKVKEALKVLEDEKLDRAYEAAKREKEKAEKAFRQSIENYMLKARLSILSFDVAEAEKNFRKAVTADPENFDNTYELATFFYKLNRFTEAVPFCEKALAIAEKNGDEPDIAKTSNLLGMVQYKRNKMDAAETAFMRALEIYEKLAKTDPDTFLPDLATTQNNLGVFYSDRNNVAAAETAYTRALEIREKLAQKDPDAYEPKLCMTLANLAIYHAEQFTAKKVETHKKKAVLYAQRVLTLAEKHSHIPAVQEYEQDALWVLRSVKVKVQRCLRTRRLKVFPGKYNTGTTH